MSEGRKLCGFAVEMLLSIYGIVHQEVERLRTELLTVGERERLKETVREHLDEMEVIIKTLPRACGVRPEVAEDMLEFPMREAKKALEEGRYGDVDIALIDMHVRLKDALKRES